jgi:hypothetical protein
MHSTDRRGQIGSTRCSWEGKTTQVLRAEIEITKTILPKKLRATIPCELFKQPKQKLSIQPPIIRGR